MPKIVERKFVSFKFGVEVRVDHINEGKCGLPSLCMEKLAIAEALDREFGAGEATRVRIDGAQIKFNLRGYRWHCTTPKKAKLALVAFDAKRPVRPHEYDVLAIRGTKIQPASAERQTQINEARKARIAAGTPDKKRFLKSLHQRVVGLGAV